MAIHTPEAKTPADGFLQETKSTREKRIEAPNMETPKMRSATIG